MSQSIITECLKKIPNRFDLVLTATEEARKIALGMRLSRVPEKGRNAALVALHEIAADAPKSEAESSVSND